VVFTLVIYGVFDISGNHSLNGQQLNAGKINHFTTKIWPLGPKQLLILPIFYLPLSISFFADRNFGVNSGKALVDLLTFKVMNKFSFMNMLLQLLHSLRQGFLTL